MKLINKPGGLAWLAERGWDTSQPYDICWLDCPLAGYYRSWVRPGGATWEICLCPEHAVLLEAGVYDGDYWGAPLPPLSWATGWPWVAVQAA